MNRTLSRVLALGVMTACAPDAENEFGSMSRDQKIELAVDILGELRPTGYCERMPTIADVANESSGRVTISLDEPERGYPESERGTMVGFNYVCGGAEGREHISEHLVNLRTREVSLHQIDVDGFPAGQHRFQK